MTRLRYNVTGPKVTGKRFVRKGDSYLLEYRVDDVKVKPSPLRNPPSVHKLNKNLARFMKVSQAVAMMQHTAPRSKTIVINDPVLMNQTSKQAILGSKTMKVLGAPCA